MAKARKKKTARRAKKKTGRSAKAKGRKARTAKARSKARRRPARKKEAGMGGVVDGLREMTSLRERLAGRNTFED